MAKSTTASKRALTKTQNLRLDGEPARLGNSTKAAGIGAVIVALVTACAGTEDATAVGEALGETEQSIINGTVLSSDDVGLVRLTYSTASGSYICSGTLLNSNWILTAKHCADGTMNTYRMRVGVGTSDSAARVSEIRTHATLDVALLRTDSALVNPATGAAFANTLYVGTPPGLVGATVDCRGYGRSTYDGGSGTLRQANLSVTSANGSSIVTSRNATPQVQWSGDSGGPCVYTSAGVRYVLSVASTCNHNPSTKTVNYCTLVAAPAFRDWAYQQMAMGPNGGTMRNGNEYRAFNSNVTWSQADSDCKSRRGHLATFTSQAELSFVTSLIPSGSYRSWIGLTDDGHEGTWTWVTGEPASLAPWSSGEPNNAGGAENWAELTVNGNMNDLPSNFAAPYICEWEAHGGGMFGGHEYLGFGVNRSWPQAQSDCAAVGSSLVTISSASENSFVTGMLPSSHTWIGLTDAGHEGQFTWASGESLTYTQWGTGEPGNSGGAENWAEIRSSGTWNDLPATWSIPYICEWPARTP